MCDDGMAQFGLDTDMRRTLDYASISMSLTQRPTFPYHRRESSLNRGKLRAYPTTKYEVSGGYPRSRPRMPEAAETFAIERTRMATNKNALLTPLGREKLCRRVVVEGHVPRSRGHSGGMCMRAGRERLGRHRDKGPTGLAHRQLRLRHSPNRTPAINEANVAELWCQRWTETQIATEMGGRRPRPSAS